MRGGLLPTANRPHGHQCHAERAPGALCSNAGRGHGREAGLGAGPSGEGGGGVVHTSLEVLQVCLEAHSNKQHPDLLSAMAQAQCRSCLPLPAAGAGKPGCHRRGACCRLASQPGPPAVSQAPAPPAVRFAQRAGTMPHSVHTERTGLRTCMPRASGSLGECRLLLAEKLSRIRIRAHRT